MKDRIVRHTFSVFLLFVAGLLCTGCPSLWNAEMSDKSSSAEDLYKAAEESFNSKKYSEAIDTFERLKSAYPDFKQIPEVYTKIADALFEEGSYEKAISRYLQYAELYPGHKGVPRAKFQVALAHFNQIKNTELDSAMVQRAAKSFKSVMDDPNAEEYAKKAEEKYKECQKKLAEKEIYKARTYSNMGNYQAARLAAKRVLEEFPKMGFDEEASKLIDKIKDK
ncbi:MAG: outer membrane protein assembly factor BamD [Desulfomonile tiedjei]|uniref:Outer membrane protein assembly factor BamD n=1 Tax=Desulfomonile tiedjei TaxID=2358 RepID=A0A9D6V3K1_9BACT|nr:outer membrane protein assembly factor BamD [Desulfomonile tiedjei]